MREGWTFRRPKMPVTMTVEEFHAALRAQGVPRDDLAFKCPICGTIQSAKDLIRAGAGKDFEGVGKFLGFSCVGRFTNAGPHQEGRAPGTGCDWTLGGLFQLHKVEVVDTDGERCPHFEVVTPEEAKAHAERR